MSPSGQPVEAGARAKLPRRIRAVSGILGSPGRCGCGRRGPWAFWRDLAIYFCVFSVAGHWMEIGYCTLIRFGLVPGTYDPSSLIWSDWLYPFCVYGFGAVACVLVLFPVKNRLERHFGGRVAPLLASFAANTLACTLIVRAMGLVLNRPGPDGMLPLWDYSDMFCNFMGQVCLQNALAFGAAATLMTWVVHPKLAAFLRQVPEGALNLVSAGMGAGFCLLLLP